MQHSKQIPAQLLVRAVVPVLESLEQRTFLHAAIYHVLPPDLVGLANDSGHVAASDFIRARPEFAGKDLWDPAIFNPTSSSNSQDWAFDPHFIENDRPQIPPPSVAGGGPEGQSLPDLIPLGQDQGYLLTFIDTTEIPGRNLLRFSTAIGNLGAGPAILVSNNSGTPPPESGLSSWVNPDGTQNVLQYVYNFDGAAFQFDHMQLAGRMVYHNTHGHFHLEGYANYRLLQNVGGQPGPVVIRSDGTQAVGDKVGFCLINVAPNFILPNGQSSTTLPGYGAPGQPGTSCGFTQGIHVGNRDVYNSIYDGQWIDVTGVTNGNYFLEVTLDALDVIEESDEVNNQIVVPVSFNANPPVGGIQVDRFEPNNSFAQATDLDVLGVQTQGGLTIHTTNENDFFKFVAASSGSYDVKLNVGDRDVNLFLYDNNQILLRSSTSATHGPMFETVTWNFVDGQTYYVRAQGFGSDLSAGQRTSGVSSNYALQVFVNPTVNASTSDGGANEIGNNSGLIQISRNGPISGALAINFTVNGNATRGVDYQLYHDGVLIGGNTVTIGVEAGGAALEVRPLHDTTPELPETATITLSNSATYVIGAGTGGTVTITDAGPEVVQSSQVWQTSPHNLVFDITRAAAGVLDQSDFSVVDLGTLQNVPVQSFGVQQLPNLDSRVTLTFNGVLPDGLYRATVTGSGVTDSLGNPMALDVIYNFFVLTGDANHDGRINLTDYNVLTANFGQNGRDASTGDFTYDGLVNLADYNVLAGKYGTQLFGPEATGGTSALPPFGGFRSRGSTFAAGKPIGQDDRLIDELARAFPPPC